jgi:hypothetical protein
MRGVNFFFLKGVQVEGRYMGGLSYIAGNK